MFKEGTNRFVQKEKLRYKTLTLPAGNSLKALSLRELGTVLSRKLDLESLRTALKGGSTCPRAAETQDLDSGLLRFTCQGRALSNYQCPWGDCLPRLDPKWGRHDATSLKHSAFFLPIQKDPCILPRS